MARVFDDSVRIPMEDTSSLTTYIDIKILFREVQVQEVKVNLNLYANGLLAASGDGRPPQ